MFYIIFVLFFILNVRLKVRVSALVLILNVRLKVRILILVSILNVRLKIRIFFLNDSLILDIGLKDRIFRNFFSIIFG